MKLKFVSIATILVVILMACGGGTKHKVVLNEDGDSSKHYDDLLQDKLGAFAVLPSKSVSEKNLSTAEKIALGHVLYFDNRLSKDQKISCNSCHNLKTFGVDNLPTSPGDAGKNGERNSPTVLNASLHTMQFWDGRAADVEEQAGMPILNAVEMAIPNEKYLIDRLAAIDLYKTMFKAAFPNDANPINYGNLKNAIGAFERELLTPSAFDKYLAGDKSALTLEEKKGLLVFTSKGCTACHSGALLGGNAFQKFGVTANYWEYTKSKIIDKGLGAKTGKEADNYMFKVPSLRNITKTGPYFHDGSVADLSEAIKIMAKVEVNQDLTPEEMASIVSFLGSLNGDVPAQYKIAPAALATTGK
jgi:cytochrome c peroxidase